MINKKFQLTPVGLLATSLLVLNTSLVLAAPAEISLEDSIAMALQNNPSIKMAIYDKDKAFWGIQETEAGRLPTLSLSNSSSRSFSQSLNVSNSSRSDSFNTSLRLNWPLYTGGRVEGAINQAKINADVAKLGVSKVQQQVKLDTTTAYFSVLQGRNLVKVNQQTVDTLTEHVRNVQSQYEVGTVAKGDVLRSEVELANAQQNLTKAQNSYDLAVANLNNLTGMPLDTQNTFKDDVSLGKYELSLVDSIQLAQKNRPEIEQSQDSIDVAKAGVKIADSGRMPTVALGGTQGWSGSEFPGQNQNWSIGVSASWNLFDAGLTSAKVKEAKASVDKASEMDKQTRDSVELEVRQSYLSMKEAEARIQTSQVAVDKATEDLKIGQAKYYAGAGTNLDVIDAQAALTQAQTNATQASYDYNVNKAKLEKATGLGVNN